MFYDATGEDLRRPRFALRRAQFGDVDVVRMRARSRLGFQGNSCVGNHEIVSRLISGRGLDGGKSRSS